MKDQKIIHFLTVVSFKQHEKVLTLLSLYWPYVVSRDGGGDA